MAKKKSEQAMTGTLIRGADGALYFVKDNQRWAIRLPDKLTKDARAILDRKGFIANLDELPAFHGSGLVKEGGEGIDVDLGRLAALGRRKPRAK